MTGPLDPRFAHCLELMAGATSQFDLAEARRGAEDVARACGLTFDEALAAMRVQPAEPHPSHPPTTRDATIAAALAADPARSDRDIAREARCSPTLVGRARAAAGLARGVRLVRRNGRAYEMRLATALPRKMS